LGTWDGHGGDGERSASVKTVNQLLNNSSYCRIKELRFSEKSWNVKFLENSSVGTDLFYEDRQTDNRTDRLTCGSLQSRFAYFVNTSKKLRNRTTSCQPLLSVRQAVLLIKAINKRIFYCFICKQCYTIQC